MPFILNEADALKTKLSGLTITDVTGTHEVPVYFRNPENEIRDMEFPSILLEISGVNKAEDREHRGHAYLPYIPEGMGPGPVHSEDPVSGLDVDFYGGQDGNDFDPNLSPFKVADYPIPYNIDFTVTVYSRFQSELIPITNDLAMIDRIPVRFGYLEVPQDGTVRTLDLMAGPEIVSERDGNGKRVFRAVYSVRTVSELSIYEVRNISSLYINRVDLDLQQIPAPTS